MSQHFIVGLGSGRCGTVSLSRLLSSQPGCAVSHELGGGPHLPWIRDRRRFQYFFNSINGLDYRVVGDVSFYSLPYAEDFIDNNEGTRFVILKRDREQTIRSYLQKTRGRNHWMNHDGKRWRHCPWDHCYPKFEAASKREAIGKFYDLYYGLCRRIDPARCFWLDTEELNNKNRVLEMLAFCGFEEPRFERVHLNKSR